MRRERRQPCCDRLTRNQGRCSGEGYAFSPDHGNAVVVGADARRRYDEAHASASDDRPIWLTGGGSRGHSPSWHYRTKIARRMMIGRGTPRSQRRMPRPIMRSPVQTVVIQRGNAVLQKMVPQSRPGPGGVTRGLSRPSAPQALSSSARYWASFFPSRTNPCRSTLLVGSS